VLQTLLQLGLESLGSRHPTPASTETEGEKSPEQTSVSIMTRVPTDVLVDTVNMKLSLSRRSDEVEEAGLVC
jgi:hypothetical protein